MKAAVLRALGQPLDIVDGIEVPALKAGQVLVKIFYTGVCHSQLMEASGARGPDRFLPHLLGHEATGEVVDLGPDVTKVRRGDRVVLGWIKGDGLDAGGTQYRRGNEVINAGGVTTFSDYTVCSENRVVPLPAGVPPDIGVLFGCAVPTGAGIVLNTVRPPPGSTVAVIGLGGIGLSALAATNAFRCGLVIAVDTEPEKLALARTLGATHTINAATEDVVEAIRTATGGKGVDFAVEAAGSARTIEMAFDAVRRGGGRCVFASHPPADQRIALDPFELICGKHIEGSWGGDSRPDRDVPVYAEHYRSGRFPLDAFVRDRYTLDDINRAMDDLANRRIVRALVEIAPPDGSV